MASTQGGPTDSLYIANPNYGPGIGFFRTRLTWAGGTDTGTVIPTDESGIQSIHEFTIHNMTSEATAVKAVVSYDTTEDKDKLTIDGVADQVFVVTMKGPSRLG